MRILLILLFVFFCAGAASSAEEQAGVVVSGYVESVGDTTPEGLLDAPRKFVFKVKRDDGSLVDVAYVAFPPAPAADEEGRRPRLTFHAGEVRVGDYLVARGTLDPEANVVTVAGGGDHIETYSEKP